MGNSLMGERSGKEALGIWSNKRYVLLLACRPLMWNMLVTTGCCQSMKCHKIYSFKCDNAFVGRDIARKLLGAFYFDLGVF